MSHCGRPYGLRMKPGTNFLYVADSIYGIVKVDTVKSINIKILVLRHILRAFY